MQTLLRTVALALVVLPCLAGQAGAALVADYRFDDSLGSSVAGAPALANVGPGNAFAWETVGPTPNRVLTFPAGSGVQVPAGFLLNPADYSVVLEFRFTDVLDYRRVLGFRNPGDPNVDTDDGLYVHDQKLDFYDGEAFPSGPGDHEGTGTPFTACQASQPCYVEVAFTRENSVSGDFVNVYANGAHQLTYDDSLGSLALLDPNDSFWFFVDNPNNEYSAGAVSRIRIYDTTLSPAEVAAIAAESDPPPPDGDGDGVYDHLDNCPSASNASQADFDGDGPGDACDDADGDGVVDATDNCRSLGNATQSNVDADGQGDACDSDDDGDGLADGSDNCPSAANAAQADLDSDGLGDACDSDDDGDGLVDGSDNCPSAANAGQAQADADADGQGDVCDSDDDGDGVADASDRCPSTADPGQVDTDSDGQGNACDSDDDGDGLADASDSCPLAAQVTDSDGDGLGDACDPDDDGDGRLDGVDACPLIARAGVNGCPAAQIRRIGKVRARRAGKTGIRVATGLMVACPLSPLTCSVRGSVVRTQAGGSAVRRLGRVSLTLQPGNGRVVNIKLTKKGAAALRKAGRLRVRIRVAATGADGRPVVVTRVARLRAPR